MFKISREEEVVLINLGLKTLLNDAMSPRPKIKTIKYNKTKKVTKKKSMSAAARARISKMMKKRWAEAKKQNRNSI